MAVPSAPGCLKDGSTTLPPALSSASTNARSDAGSDGEEKSTSNATSRTPALSSRRSKSACSRRGQGQTPICSIEGASMATTTISPLAWRCCQANRRSVSALRSAPCRPDDSTIVSATTTKICGR
jgi:hypothetical protein